LCSYNSISQARFTIASCCALKAYTRICSSCYTFAQCSMQSCTSTSTAPSMLIFLSALAAASSIRPPIPIGNSTNLRARSSNANAKLSLHRASVTGSITKGEMKRVLGACKAVCPGYGGIGSGRLYKHPTSGKYVTADCCIPACMAKVYECRDSACEKEVLKKSKNTYMTPVEGPAGGGFGVFTNTTSLNTSLKLKRGHHFSDDEIQEANEHCVDNCYHRDNCCVQKCKVDLPPCVRRFFLSWGLLEGFFGRFLEWDLMGNHGRGCLGNILGGFRGVEGFLVGLGTLPARIFLHPCCTNGGTQESNIRGPERFSNLSRFVFRFFGFWAAYLVIFDLRFGFCASKSSPGAVKPPGTVIMAVLS